MGNSNNKIINCEYNLCNNYELDWLSEKSWDIKYFPKNNFYKLKKGILEINTPEVFNINFSKEICNPIRISDLNINFKIEFDVLDAVNLDLVISSEKNLNLLDKKIYNERLILGNKNIQLKNKNNLKNFNLNTKKFFLKYNLNFSNNRILIINIKLYDNDKQLLYNNTNKDLVNIDFKNPIFININIYKNINTNNKNYIKLNL